MKKKVIYFKPNDTVFDVAKVLSEHNISGAPVVDKGKVVGVLSDSDIIKFIRLKIPEESAGSVEPHIWGLVLLSLVKGQFQFRKELKRISKIKAKDIMSNLVFSISPEASLVEAAELMEKNNVHRLPVIEGEKLVGILSRADLIRALIE